MFAKGIYGNITALFKQLGIPKNIQNEIWGPDPDDPKNRINESKKPFKIEKSVKIKILDDDEFRDDITLIQNDGDRKDIIANAGLKGDKAKYQYYWVKINDGDYEFIYGSNSVDVEKYAFLVYVDAYRQHGA